MAEIAHARLFDGSDDGIRMAVGDIDTAYTGLTVAAIVKPTDAAAYRTIYGIDNEFQFGLADGSELFYWDDVNSNYRETAGNYLTNAMGWTVVAVTKADGSAAARAHRYRYDTTAFDHSNIPGGNAGDPVTPNPASQVWIGQFEDIEGWNGLIACVGVWMNQALSDGNFETLTADIAAWEALNPTALWLLNQDSTATAVEDRVGTSDQAALSGTSVQSISDLPFDVGGDPEPDLYTFIDEETFSDTDYIRSPDDPVEETCRMKLGTGGTPAVDTGHKIRWRIRKSGGGGNAILTIYQGGGDNLGAGTLIATRTRENPPSSFTTYEETLTEEEAGDITNYGDLYIEITGDVT